MDDVRGDFLGPLHGTTPAAVIANKLIDFESCTINFALIGYVVLETMNIVDDRKYNSKSCNGLLL